MTIIRENGVPMLICDMEYYHGKCRNAYRGLSGDDNGTLIMDARKQGWSGVYSLKKNTSANRHYCPNCRDLQHIEGTGHDISVG